MKLRNSTNSNQSNNKADGYLNLTLIAKDGSEHNFRMGIPLFRDRAAIDNNLLNNPDIVDAFTMDNIKLTVHVMEDNDPDIELEF